MGKIRFRLKQRVTTMFRCLFRRGHSPARYHRLNPPESSSPSSKPVLSLLNWARALRRKAKSITWSKKLPAGGRGYAQLGEEHDKGLGVPKGHITVYVGGTKSGDFERVLVPVMYFNHPLFWDLLREAEEEYGYDHPAGGITLPCPISELEHVQTQIKRGRASRKSMMMMMMRKNIAESIA